LMTDLSASTTRTRGLPHKTIKGGGHLCRKTHQIRLLRS